MIFCARTLTHVLLLSAFLVNGSAAAAQRDTLNRADPYGRKFGWWELRAPQADKPDHPAGALIEAGRYDGGKRTGIWKRYWPNGQVMSEISYVAGRPRGPYRIFYPDGRTEEQGDWQIDRNTGAFKRWHPNGKLAQDFVFDDHGVRNGVQRYYHPNGQLEVEVTVKDGKEEGTLQRYRANGELHQKAEFRNGVINEANSRFIRSVKKEPAPEVDPSAAVAPQRSPEEVTNAMLFRENGFNTLYDKQLRITQQGEFRTGRLWKGRVYRYDPKGLLYRIEVFENGRYIGNAPIEDEDRK